MRTQRTRFTEWFAKWHGPRTREEELAVLEFADAYDNAIAAGQLSEAQLQCIVDAASSPRALLWMNATDLLAGLASRWSDAADAIRAMFGSNKAHVRFAALCCLTPTTPLTLTDKLLAFGLVDKSFRVRWKAAEKIFRFERKDLIPKMETALHRETNPKAYSSIQLHLRLLRDGMIVKPARDSGFYITVRSKENGICSGYISDERMREHGPERLAEELRQK